MTATETTTIQPAATQTTAGSVASSDPKGATAIADVLYGSNVATKVDTVQDQKAAPDADTGKIEGDGKDAPKAEVDGAPERYEFKPTEGRKFDNEVLNTYSDVARELNLSQKSAQMILDKMGPKVAERQAAQLEAIRTEWASTSRGDKEFGGDSLAANLSVAKKALDTFGTPELRSLLNESGLGNHPELIRFFFRAGKSISEDAYVGSSNGAGSSKGPPRDFAAQATALYGNQSQK